ncbi:hypothetical protein CEF21_13070 [Bacillus sp. FJAT-42376]|nr:hypothetical protein CEF21_13070 [Bacillus sp. FJAT-42376]
MQRFSFACPVEAGIRLAEIGLDDPLYVPISLGNFKKMVQYTHASFFLSGKIYSCSFHNLLIHGMNGLNFSGKVNETFSFFHTLYRGERNK